MSRNIIGTKENPRITIFVTKNFKFRAKVEVTKGERSCYEVTVGGKSWSEGKGREHQERIMKRIKSILNALSNEERRIENESSCNISKRYI